VNRFTAAVGDPDRCEPPGGDGPGAYTDLRRAGINRVTVLAWRDVGRPDSGGSEIYVDRVTREWARAGLDVTLRTGRLETQESTVLRDGVTVERRGGTLSAVPLWTARGLLRRLPPTDAVVEVWNGLPFLTPLWAGRPRLTVLHHLHDRLWHDFLPPGPAHLGRWAERSLFPPLYRSTPVATLAESSRGELLRRTRLRGESVHVVQPGVDGRFTPGGSRSPAPLVLVVARLVPSKRVAAALDATLAGMRSIESGTGGPFVEVIGTGPERPSLEASYRGRVKFRGRLDDSELVEAYRRAWLVVSASGSEGWGMTITEAGACGTPSVALDTPGHRDAVDDGVSGILTSDTAMSGAVARVMGDPELRRRLGAGALRKAATLRWERTAARLARLMADQVESS